MSFWEWLGVKKAKPNYGEAESVYKRMMDMSDIDKMRESRMQDWRGIQQRAFGDISRDVGQKWGGTGANLMGVESSMPGQWQTQASSRWMQDVGNPMARNIEQEWLGATMQQKQGAEMARQQLEEQARAEAAAKTGAGAGLVGNILGTAASFIPGVGPFLGAGISAAGNALGGGSAQGYAQNRNMQNWWDPRRNPYLNQSNPIYYPQDSMGGGQPWNYS